MSPDQTIDTITVEALVERVRALRDRNYRIVQVGATRLPEDFELTYSFDLDGKLLSLRLLVPASAARVPSISAIYGCAALYENELHDLFNLEVQGMTLDFKGNFYKTAVKFPFGATKPVVDKPAAAPAPAAPQPPSTTT